MLFDLVIFYQTKIHIPSFNFIYNMAMCVDLCWTHSISMLICIDFYSTMWLGYRTDTSKTGGWDHDASHWTMAVAQGLPRTMQTSQICNDVINKYEWRHNKSPSNDTRTTTECHIISREHLCLGDLLNLWKAILYLSILEGYHLTEKSRVIWGMKVKVY